MLSLGTAAEYRGRHMYAVQIQSGKASIDIQAEVVSLKMHSYNRLGKFLLQNCIKGGLSTAAVDLFLESYLSQNFFFL